MQKYVSTAKVSTFSHKPLVNYLEVWWKLKFAKEVSLFWAFRLDGRTFSVWTRGEKEIENKVRNTQTTFLYSNEELL